MGKNFSDTLKELRLSAGFTQKQVYEILGVPQSTFSSWEIGKAEPSADVLLRLCEIYGVTDILAAFGYNGYDDDGSLQLNIKEIEVVEKYRQLDAKSQQHINSVLEWELEKTKTEQEQLNRIAELENQIRPRYFMTYYQKLASAGTGEYLFSDVPTDTIEVPFDDISSQADFVIGVNGDSMEPDFYDGEKVYVRKTDELAVGKVGIFVQGNECYIKEKGADCLISRNKKYADLIPSSDIRLIGEVIGKVK